MTALRRVIAATTVGVLVSLFLVAFGSPAQAAWYCGDTCNRTDPNNYYVTPYQTCAMDAQTVSSNYSSAHGLTLQLRYSPYCRTVWGRIYGGGNQNYFVGLERVYGPGDYEQLNATREIPRERSFSWSYQWNDANVTIRACVATYWAFESPWLIMCTGGN